MRNKRTAILVILVLVAVLVTACVMAAPGLVDAIRGLHVIPHH